MTEADALPGPGWYEDPNDPASNRYWDGNGWTDSRERRQDAVARRVDFETVDGVGYALAVLFPLVGFIIGLVRLNKSKQGVWIVVVSVVAFFIWLGIVASSGGNGRGY